MIKLSKMKEEYVKSKLEEEKEALSSGDITIERIKEELPNETPEDTEVTYEYLNNEELNMDYGLGMTADVSYNHNLCVYRINRDLNIPFLEFALVFKDGVYKFPMFDVPYESQEGLILAEESDLDEPSAESNQQVESKPIVEEEGTKEVAAETPVTTPAAETSVTKETPVTEPIAENPVENPSEPPATEETPVTAPTAETPVENPSETPVTAPTAEPPVTAPTAEPPVTAPTAEPPVTAPTAEPPVTAPTAEPPVTEAPVSEPTAETPVTPPTATETPITETQVTTPTEPAKTNEPEVAQAPAKKWFFFGGEPDEKPSTLFTDKVNETYRDFMNDTKDVKYKGFTETHIDKEIYITAVVECSDYNQNEQNRLWVSLDEIIYKNEVNGVAIDKTVYRVFYEHAFLCHIKEKTGTFENPTLANAPIPVTMYMCSRDDSGALINVYYPEGEQNVYSLLTDTVEHPFFGPVYLFTTEPIDANRKSGLKRFSVFIDDALYIMNKDEDISQHMPAPQEKEEDNQPPTKTYVDYSAVRYYEGDLKVWAVNNVNVFTEP